MLKQKKWVLIIPVFLVVVFLLAWAACRAGWFGAWKEQLPEEFFLPEPEEVLEEHALLFERRVEQVTDGIYVAVGYALGNSVLIVTEEGNVIVDTTESMEAASEIREEFERISDAPLLAVIYTHGHPDHILGTAAFLEGREETVEIYAHASTLDFLEEQFGQLNPILNLRGMRQFGTYLPEGYLPCIGLGPFLRFDHEKIPAFIFPTTVFEEELVLHFGKKKLVLMHLPGETEDQIGVWLPEEKVLLCGDNFYPAFPNLYTIRGTAPRPVREWINSLNKMRDLGAEHLVPSHSGPVHGAERIYELLTAYRDAIQYIHDAVVRGANQGKTIDELVEEIRLPEHLLAYPELRELYGSVAWSVRAIYQGYLGWFDGNATQLYPLSPGERAERVAELVGGRDRLLVAAQEALAGGDYQWAAELADLVLALEPGDGAAVQVKVEALLKLGQASINTNARAYYFTQAFELKGLIKPAGRLQVDAAMAHLIPLDKLFENMAVRLDPFAAADKVITAGFRMTDTGETYTVAVRRGIAEIRPGFPAEPDLVINVEENLWKELALGVRSPLAALVAGSLKIEGSILLAREFFGLFEQ